MKRAIQRNRDIKSKDLAMTMSRATRHIPEQFQLTKRGDQFLLSDNGTKSGEERMLIFGTDESLLWLVGSASLLADGTFKASPALFAQLFVLHGIREDKASPCLYPLLPSKEEKVYDALVKAVKGVCPYLNPTRIYTDFKAFQKNSSRPRCTAAGFSFVGPSYGIYQSTAPFGNFD